MAALSLGLPLTTGQKKAILMQEPSATTGQNLLKTVLAVAASFFGVRGSNRKHGFQKILAGRCAWLLHQDRL
ncbi:MAG: DUF2970 domain-containing protein, partial [Betaproteobacteria bacterium]|nr:DUF2970 domain-containing protein [Betaproteobacteria bacterium]NCX62737.1 DUF2970 domain-containing protein [Betaproteobacteria bacterium]